MSSVNVSPVSDQFQSEDVDQNDEVIATRQSEGVVGSKRKTPSSSIQRKPMAPRSWVWNHFNRLAENKDRCQCTYCGKQYECKSGVHGTTNMGNHLKKCPQYLSYEENQAVLAKERGGRSEEGDGSNLVARGFSQDAVRKATVKMIVVDELSFSHVDNPGFRNLMSVACPRFQVPSRRTISRDILNMYVEEKTALKSLLCVNKQRVSLTTDIWTAITTASYMVITSHFIDQDWKLHRRIISFNTIPDHKGETICKQLEKCLLDWGIDRVFTLTVDNASANEVAVKKLLTKLKTLRDDALVLGGEFLHVRCCAHILNLIVTEGLSELDDSVVSIRNAVKYVRSSGVRLKAFKIRVEQEKITCKGSVILDCVTRWNSTYTMLNTALKFKLAFDRMANEDKLYDAYFHEKDSVTKMERKGPPTESDWDNARRMVRFLKTFYDATLTFSSSLTVSSSLSYNEICKVESTLGSLCGSDDAQLGSMALSMKMKFDKYWEGTEKINKLLIVAAILDPRGKMNFATLCFERLYGKGSAKCGAMKESVKKVLQMLFREYSTRYAGSNVSGSQSVADQGSSEFGEGSNLMDINDTQEDDDDDPFAFYSKMVAVSRDVQDLSNELDIYLMEPVEYPINNRLGTKFDILLWWRVNSVKYPILSHIARDVLAIPVSTVASESAFSTGGRIVDEYRSSLTPDMVEALILTQNWMRSKLCVDTTKNFQTVVEENEFLDQLAEELRNQISPNV